MLPLPPRHHLPEDPAYIEKQTALGGNQHVRAISETVKDGIQQSNGNHTTAGKPVMGIIVIGSQMLMSAES